MLPPRRLQAALRENLGDGSRSESLAFGQKMKILRLITVFLLIASAAAWWLVIGDVYTSMAYSNSFATLSTNMTDIAVYGSIVACSLAAIFSIVAIFRDPNRRWLSSILFTASILLVPTCWIYAGYVADTTEPAILQNK